MPRRWVSKERSKLNTRINKQFLFNSYVFPEKLKTLLTAKLSAASMKKRHGRLESNRERRARAYLALKNAMWVSRSRSRATRSRSNDQSIDLCPFFVRRRARAREGRRWHVRKKRANLLLARRLEGRPSGSLLRRRAKLRRSRRSGTRHMRSRLFLLCLNT